MKPLISRLLTRVMVCLSILGVNSEEAYAEAVLTKQKELSFGLVMFIPGNCQMDYETGDITISNPPLMCNLDDNSVAGRYTITATPNTQVSIKFNQRSNEGDGFIFIPEGIMFSDTESVAIAANTSQQLDSGVSGVIRIQFGGRIFITQQISPSSAFEITNVTGIEWSEIP